jgi:hypothetical protein
MFLSLTTEYLSSVTDCLINVGGEVIDVFVQEAKCCEPSPDLCSKNFFDRWAFNFSMSNLMRGCAA